MAVLTTNRCRMDLLSEKDFPSALPLLTNNEVRRYLGGTITETAALEKLTAWTSAKDDIYLTVRLICDGTFIGLVSVSPHHDESKKELSYQFLPEFWGKGCAFEVLQAVLAYCRDTLGIREAVSETQTKNIRSCRLLEKLGYRLTEQLIRFGAEQNLYAITL